MANDQHVNLLKQGRVIWNVWRTATAPEDPDFANADLTGADLGGLDLSGVDLIRANLYGADLSGANLSGAYLKGANLNGANLSKANLSKANLSKADLSEAELARADLTAADLTAADLTGTLLIEANLSEARVTYVHWERSRMRGRYLGIRGLDSCFGNALFRRAAADQDFLDTLEARWGYDSRLLLFRLWGWLDYGRSMWRVAAFGFAVTTFFAAIFYLWPSLLDYRESAPTWFTPYYYSVVTFTTLGFGDVRPAGAIAEILAAIEVVIGYVTLGLLLAVLAEKLARRS